MSLTSPDRADLLALKVGHGVSSRPLVHKLTDSSINTARTTKYTGPNGHIEWLNCGIDGGGWKPPRITLENVKAKSLDEALAMPGTHLARCRPFLQWFNKYGWENGIPPIMIATFAFQESSCNPNTRGQGGEAGLMQITKDKCGGAPGGDCFDPVRCGSSVA